jgi:nicotinate-nucleotide adenylyltransferase
MTGLLGVLGGIFDPVHNGHLAVASLAREALGLEKIIFIPSGNPPHKSTSICASASDRLNMLRCALEEETDSIIWEGELNRPGISYTIDTLHELIREFNRPLYFIIGSDNLHEICSWHRYREIIDLVSFCVASRPGYSDMIPEELSNATVKFIPSPRWGISSSMIRSYFSQGYTCKHLLPSSVIDYILKKKLYITKS